MNTRVALASQRLQLARDRVVAAVQVAGAENLRQISANAPSHIADHLSRIADATDEHQTAEREYDDAWRSVR